MTKIPACLAAARTSPARSKVCRSCTMGFCAMFPAEKSAMSSAVVLLSSVISAIPHLPLALTTPLGYVRSTDVCRDGHEHACRISPSLHVTAAPPRVGSRHRTPPVRRIIPEYQRGLQTGDSPRHNFRYICGSLSRPYAVGIYAKRSNHIPPDFVVEPRYLHHSLEIVQSYPHPGSSAATTI